MRKTKILYICDVCGHEQIVDANSCPQGWIYEYVQSSKNTGYGYTINSTTKYDLCSKECLEEFKDG